ncbi:2OG-Fe dioxygenase family protein [Nocardia transvalensis]|uniref:2OG-Fe dioxygenase family protein n=1 Tax=Nocardia transvalensis TaxID=37333 RepID=UPI001E3AD9FE|nr:2OG-Fe dioxygenase family protein [Nocardia transvalensis]
MTSPIRTELFGPLPDDRFGRDPVVVLAGRPAADLPADLGDGLTELADDFEDLPDDRWLKTDYVFRQRRFTVFTADTLEHRIDELDHRPFYQDSGVNPYAGGIARQFEPLAVRTRKNPFLHQLIWDVLAALPESRVRAARYWEIGVHLMRILAFPDKPGYPAPEGMHHDGHAFTSISLIDRKNVEGGRSLFADLDRVVYRKLELEVPLDTVIFEDPRCLHDVTSVTVTAGADRATRDVCGFSLNPMAEAPGAAAEARP